MSILIKGMEMPQSCMSCRFLHLFRMRGWNMGFCPVKGVTFPVEGSILTSERIKGCPLIEVPPHGDLIDRDALIKDGWSNLHKEVMRMGGYAIHELPLKNPSIPVVIEKENG